MRCPGMLGGCVATTSAVPSRVTRGLVTLSGVVTSRPLTRDRCRTIVARPPCTFPGHVVSVAHMKRVALSLNVPESVRDALDLRVKEGRAKGFPVERASLAAHILETALRLDGLREGEPKLVVRAMTALLGELASIVPGIVGRVEASLRSTGLAKDRIDAVMGALEVNDAK